MNFGDVYDLTSGEEVLIDELAFQKIVEYVEETTEDEGAEDTPTDEPEQGGDDPETPPAEEGTEEVWTKAEVNSVSTAKITGKMPLLS